MHHRLIAGARVQPGEPVNLQRMAGVGPIIAGAAALSFA